MSNIFRVDQNFAINAINWVNLFKEDFKLCFDIMFYITNKVQTEIFKFGYICLDDFCKVMGYQKRNLQTLYCKQYSDKPTQQKYVGNFLSNEKRDQQYITVFENALFKLGRFNIPFYSKYVDTETGEVIKNTKWIQVLKETGIHQTKKNKIYYTYVTSEEFDYNLSKLFFVVDFNLLQSLRKKNLTLLYMHLNYHQNLGKTEWLDKNFVGLCRLSGVNLDLETINFINEKEFDPKTKELNRRKIKDAKYLLQKRKLDELKKHFNFDYKPVHVNGRYDYGFKFIFNNNIDKTPSENDAINERLLLNQAQHQHILLKIIKLYINYYPNDRQLHKFEAWFVDSNEDFEEKKTIFFNALSDMVNKSAGELYQTQFNYFTKFFSSLKDSERTTILNQLNRKS